MMPRRSHIHLPSGYDKSHRAESLKRALRICWNDFGKSTSIHGVRFLTNKSTSFAGKIFWCTILVVCGVVVSVFIYYLWLRYMEAPTRTTIKSQHIPISLVPFPAITICPPAMIPRTRVDYFLNIPPEGFKLANWSKQNEGVYRAINQLSSILDYEIASQADFELLEEIVESRGLDIAEFLHNAPIFCGSLMVKCRWNFNELDCDKLFSTIMTEKGFCCTFNYEGTKSMWYNASFSTGFGLFSGLEVILNSDIQSLEPFINRSIINLYIHDPFTFPTSSLSTYAITEGKETAIALQVAYTISEKAIRELHASDRRCVFRDEFTLMSFSSFTYENCISECQMRHFQNRCGCVPYYFTMAVMRQYKFCKPTEFLCIVRNYASMLALRTSTTCRCPIECNLLRVKAKLSEWNFSPLVPSVLKFYKGVSSTNSIVHVYFAKSHTIQYRKVLSLRGITFTANLGGLICFFLGCSFVSIFEILYFFVFRLYRCYHQMRLDCRLFFVTPLYLEFNKQLRHQPGGEVPPST